jgi:quercetin dioxygenase-like cupin family protein
MHRTLSLDYAVVLSGEIVLELDSGEEKTVREGEFIVQRGANHAWHNRSETEVCRIVFVMVGAEAMKSAKGEDLAETVILK